MILFSSFESFFLDANRSLAKQIDGKVDFLNQEGACIQLSFPVSV